VLNKPVHCFTSSGDLAAKESYDDDWELVGEEEIQQTKYRLVIMLQSFVLIWSSPVMTSTVQV